MLPESRYSGNEVPKATEKKIHCNIFAILSLHQHYQQYLYTFRQLAVFEVDVIPIIVVDVTKILSRQPGCKTLR